MVPMRFQTRTVTSVWDPMHVPLLAGAFNEVIPSFERNPRETASSSSWLPGYGDEIQFNDQKSTIACRLEQITHREVFAIGTLLGAP